MKRMTIPTMVSLALLSTSAHARPGLRPDPNFSASDWGMAFLAGDAAGALGVAVGGGIGYGLANGGCNDSPDREVGFGGCGFRSLGGFAIGGSVGSIFGGAGGIYAYGELSGHRGSYWAAAGGWTVGLAGAIGAGALFADTDAGAAVGWTALFTLPVLGGTLGYVLSLDDGGDGRQAAGGLLDVDRGDLRLGVPAVGVALDKAGAVNRVDVQLVGGRF